MLSSCSQSCSISFTSSHFDVLPPPARAASICLRNASMLSFALSMSAELALPPSPLKTSSSVFIRAVTLPLHAAAGEKPCPLPHTGSARHEYGQLGVSGAAAAHASRGAASSSVRRTMLAAAPEEVVAIARARAHAAAAAEIAPFLRPRHFPTFPLSPP